MRIDSDSPSISTCLEELIGLLKGNGAWFDRKLLITCRNGELSVSYEGNKDNKDPLITLPESNLIPNEFINLYIEDDQFKANPKEKFLTPLQLSITHKLIELYNLCDKVKKHEQDCIVTKLEDHPDILKSLFEMRPTSPHQDEYIAYLDGERSQDEKNKLICTNFLNSRLLGQTDEDFLGTKPVIMPIIELINHHISGATFMFRKIAGNKSLNIMRQQPNPDSNEIFVFYFILDALDTALHYNFIDTSSHFVRSIPLTLNVGTYGELKIHSIAAKNKDKVSEHMRPLQTLMPPLPVESENGYEVSHLLFAFPPATHATRRILFDLVENLYGPQINSPEEILSITHDLEKEIFDKNVSYYQNLKKKIEDLLQTNPEHQGLLFAREITIIQLRKLQLYHREEMNIDNFLEMHKGKNKKTA
jgi:hypothetical protein